jgi:opacity protein-like surface antigen
MKKTLMTIVLALVAMLSVNAQDKVSTATSWDFESYASGSVISNGLNSINGLYVRGAESEGHDIIAEIHKRSGKLADGTAWKTRMAASINGNGALKKDVTSKVRPANDANPKIDRCFALNTAVAGTLTVLISPRKAVDDRSVFLVFDNQVVATGDAGEDKVYELTYKADKPGVFWFGADCQYFVYQVKFTPAE